VFPNLLAIGSASARRGVRRIVNSTGKKRLLGCLAACVLAVCFCPRAAAQEEDDGTHNEFWPEVNVYVNLNSKWRLFFLANVSKSRDTQSNLEGQVGAHADYFVNDKLSLRAGYRYGFSLAEGEPHEEHRVLFEQTVRAPLPGRVMLSDRNREELRVVNGDFSARYRNRATLEREFAIGRYKFTPYASGEVFYDTRFNVFNRNRLTAGVQLPLGKGLSPFREHNPLAHKSLSLDLYFTRQNDSRSKPHHVNAVGAVLVFSY
jgi:hypothetical protein